MDDVTPGTCKNCGAVIADEQNAFCDKPDDACWHEWCAKGGATAERGLTTIRDWSNQPPRPLYEQDRFWAHGREFNRQAPGSLVWVSGDGWRFWLGEQLPDGRWTMGCDRGQGEPVFTFGIYEGPEQVVLAEMARIW